MTVLWKIGIGEYYKKPIKNKKKYDKSGFHSWRREWETVLWKIGIGKYYKKPIKNKKQSMTIKRVFTLE